MPLSRSFSSAKARRCGYSWQACFVDAFQFSYTADELPDPVEISTGATSYKSKAEMNGNVLHYTRLYQITDVRVSTWHLNELKQFYRQVDAEERATAVFKRRAQ